MGIGINLLRSQGKASLSGVVTDAGTGVPLSGVMINLDRKSTQTGSNGEYSLNKIKPGNYPVSFTKSGYQTVIK